MSSLETIGDYPIAFIGDVHGCINHVRTLLQKLDGRHLLFLGDIVDRGEHSGNTLKWIKEMYDAGECHVIMGNHDWRLYRYLIGNNVKLCPTLERTLKECHEAFGEDLTELRDWIGTWPIFIETDNWIGAHAAWSFECRTDHKLAKQLCLYGETTKAVDKEGYPVRTYGWRDTYWGNKHIFHGHDAGKVSCRRNYPDITVKTNGAKILNLDTAACHGWKLTACLYPEFEIIQS